MYRTRYSQPSMVLTAILSIFVAAFFSNLVLNYDTASATPITDFKAGRIIEDGVFTNSTSMDTSKIQAFLNSKVTACDTWGAQKSEFGGGTRRQWAEARGHSAPFTCLKDYSENGNSAAQIIFNTSQQYQINPQVLVVLLQKEQGLVTDTWPISTQFKTATGYGCPDTAACDSQYFGLTNQLAWAAKMFRAILNNSPTWYTPYNLGNNYIRWNPESSCGGTNVNIENRSTQALYNYTPYQPNAAALAAEYGSGDTCSAYGNRNFYVYFRDWFGNSSGPAAYSVAGSSTIFVPVEGYSLAVPYMAAMHDYGISADSVRTVSQSYLDSRPTPPAGTGISKSISHVVKSPSDLDEDGGSIYLISRGQRYQFTTMDQFYSFGFKESDISYLPLGYIFSLNKRGFASNFISSPYGSLFKIENKTKRIFFEYQSYIAANPSDSTTALSYYLTDKISSGNPITDKAVMIQQPTGGAVSLYQNDTYYGIDSYATLSCWGLADGRVGVPTYRLPQSDYVAKTDASQNLSCLVSNAGATQLLANTKRVSIPSSITSIIALNLDSNLKKIVSKIPLRENGLSPYVKSYDSAGVWYIEANTRRAIPSYTAFTMMGLSAPNVDTIPDTLLDAIPDTGIKLAEGQLVKTSDSAVVYVLTEDQRVAYDSSTTFEAFGNKWSNIETFNRLDLDKNYPSKDQRISNIVVDKALNKVYIINSNKCYLATPDTLQGIGKTVESLKESQKYNSNIFRWFTFAKCSNQSTVFTKQAGQSLVYWLNNGQKHPLTYNAMLNRNNGVSPVVVDLDSEILSTIPTGQTLDR